MKIFLITGILAISTLRLSAQKQETEFKIHEVPKSNIPTYVINGKIIAGEFVLKMIQQETIESMNIWKEHNTPPHLRNLEKYGIIDVYTSVPVKAKTQQELISWFNLTGNVKIAVDGFFVQNDSLLIATDAIVEVEVTRPSPENPEQVINIWTMLPAERKRSTTDFTKRPKGILIR